MDQTNVELPGQAFDIDYLAMDAYSLDYVIENQNYYDRLEATAWYNRTRLNGSLSGQENASNSRSWTRSVSLAPRMWTPCLPAIV